MTVETMFIDSGVVVAGKIVLTGWTVGEDDPVTFRLETSDGRVGEAGVECCVRFDRADVAELYGHAAIDVGCAIGIAVEPFAGLDLFAASLTLMVLDAVAAAKVTGPAAIDGIGPTEGWQNYWQKTDAARRKASGWANGR